MKRGYQMNMNDDNFFDDIQDDIQENDNELNSSYQTQKNKKTKLILTVVVSFVVGLIMLGILLFFLSGDKDEDMVSINSLRQQNSQFQGIGKLEPENNMVSMVNNNSVIDAASNVPAINRNVSNVNENKVVPVKKIVKRNNPITKKKAVSKKTITPIVPKKIIEENQKSY